MRLGAHQMTMAGAAANRCDRSNPLTTIDEPSGTTVTFAYDANGNRDQKTVTTGGSNPTTYQVNDTYQNGHLAAQCTLGGTLPATFTYDPSGIPESAAGVASPPSARQGISPQVLQTVCHACHNACPSRVNVPIGAEPWESRASPRPGAGNAPSQPGMPRAGR